MTDSNFDSLSTNVPVSDAGTQEEEAVDDVPMSSYGLRRAPLPPPSRVLDWLYLGTWYERRLLTKLRS